VALDEICSNVVVLPSGTIVALCAAKNPAGTADGTACSDSSTCASAECRAPYGICTEVCASAADCSGAPQDCVDLFRNGNTVITGCAQGCVRDADCLSGLECALVVDTADDLYKWACTLPRGPDAVGADCSGAIHCGSGMCLTTGGGSKICTAPCVNGATDCPAGNQQCISALMWNPSNSSQQSMHVCM